MRAEARHAHARKPHEQSIRPHDERAGLHSMHRALNRVARRQNIRSAIMRASRTSWNDKGQLPHHKQGTIRIVNRQHLWRIPRKIIELVVRDLLRHAPAVYTSSTPITLYLVDNDGMREVNRVCFSKDDTTDVIAVPYRPLPGIRSGAELFVNVQRALDVGHPSAHKQAHELALYIAHGLDHLGGQSDKTRLGRRRMLQRETRWVRTLERKGVLKRLVHTLTGGALAPVRRRVSGSDWDLKLDALQSGSHAWE